MKQKINYFVLTFAFLLFVCSIDVSACTCMVWFEPQCARFSSSAAVFVGRISSIKKPSKKQLKESDGFARQFIYFDVEHPLKNVISKQVRIATDYNTSCAYENISVGQRWLVYAAKNDDGLVFGKCGGSHRIDDKKELSEVLAELPPVKNKQRIFLAVQSVFNRFEALEEVKAYTFINGQKIEAVKNDSYLMFDVPSAGKYKIQISLPYRADLSDIYEDTLSKISVSEDESIYETEMQVGADECGFRQFDGLSYRRTSSANTINSLFYLADFSLYRLQNK